MDFLPVFFGFLISTGVYASTGQEATISLPLCPWDSNFVDDICKCNYTTCEKPPCDKFLNLISNSTNNPGDCCDKYSCDPCPKEIIEAGNCTCPDGADFTEDGNCVCMHVHKTLVDGICVCDKEKCPILEKCDEYSVAIKVKEECCPNIICKTCPVDSHPTNYNTDEIEDKCVCFPCSAGAPQNCDHPIKKRRGTNFPGQCCDLYECKPACSVNGTNYSDGDVWETEEGGRCECQRGIKLCNLTTVVDSTESPLSCSMGGKFYSHNSTWAHDSCTNCTCDNGKLNCIAHICDVKLEEKSPCYNDEKYYAHDSTWIEDTCSNCTCQDGKIICNRHLCDFGKEIDECRPLTNCNRNCRFGYKLNKNGCQICKCKIPRIHEITHKYVNLQKLLETNNISEETAESIFKEYIQREFVRTSTENPISTPTSPHNDHYIIIIAGVVLLFIVIIPLYLIITFWNRRSCKYTPIKKKNGNELHQITEHTIT